MNTRIVRGIAAVSLAAAAAQAGALVVQGNAGVVYSREDQWGPRQTVPRLDVDLALTLGGFFYHPDLFRYDGTVGYRRSTLSLGGEEASSVRDSLNYGLRGTLFGHKGSIFSMSGHASQREEDFSSGAGDSSIVSRAYGGDVRLSLPGRLLNFGYTRSEDTQDLPGIGEIERRGHLVSAAISQGGETFTYAARYLGTFTEGTFASDNANEHRLTVNGKADLSASTTVQFSDGFFRRTPGNDSPFNPRQETNGLQVGVSSRASSRSFHQGSYAYQRGIQLTPGADDIERLSHSLSYGHDRILENPEWLLGASLTGTLALDRLGETETRTAGQTLGTSVTWRRQAPDRQTQIRVGPQVALQEPDGGSVDVGYGAAASASIVRGTTVSWQAGYDVAYAQALYADRGWSFRQSLNGSVTRPLGLGQLSAQLAASGERRESALFGAGGTRALLGRAVYLRGRYSASLSASVSSGLSHAVSSGGDGLFLALPYDSHTYSASLSASAALARRLTFTSALQASSTTLVDRPRSDDLAASAGITYSIAAMSFSLDDRYVVFRVGGNEFRSNTLLVTASRAFNARF